VFHKESRKACQQQSSNLAIHQAIRARWASWEEEGREKEGRMRKRREEE